MLVNNNSPSVVRYKNSVCMGRESSDFLKVHKYFDSENYNKYAL